MKNITRTIKTAHVQFAVKTENGFDTMETDVVLSDAAAARASIKAYCADAGVKFLGDYVVISTVERLYSMPLSDFILAASVVDPE